MAPFLTEAVEATWGQKSFKWLFRHKFPLLRNPLNIGFWYICQKLWSRQVSTLCQSLVVDPVMNFIWNLNCYSVKLSAKLWWIPYGILINSSNYKCLYIWMVLCPHELRQHVFSSHYSRKNFLSQISHLNSFFHLNCYLVKLSTTL